MRYPTVGTTRNWKPGLRKSTCALVCGLASFPANWTRRRARADTSSHRGEEVRTKEKTLAEAGISTSAAHRYEDLAGGATVQGHRPSFDSPCIFALAFRRCKNPHDYSRTTKYCAARA